MTDKSKLVAKIIANRRNIKKEDFPMVCNMLFKLAIEDREAADVLIKDPNRLIQAFEQYIPKTDLIQFGRLYPDLIELLIKNARISPSLAKEIRLVKVELEFPRIIKLKEESHEHLRSDPLDGRTRQAVENNRFVKLVAGKPVVDYNGAQYPLVTRKTRNFVQTLFSAGSSNSREIIMLDPSSKLLQSIYDRLKTRIPRGASTLEILKIVSLLTQEQFRDDNVDDFIAQRLNQGENFLSLDEFIREGKGVCRHHTLLNAYLLSRLVQDKMIEGEVIHHRQNFESGAHTWDLFRDSKDGKLYSLDSLWKNVTSLADQPGALDRLYRCPVEQNIFSRYGAAQKVIADKSKPIEWLDAELVKDKPGEIKKILAKPGSDHLDDEKILNNIKEYIIRTPFTVSDFFLFKGGVDITIEGGTVKRVPHRVAEIYKTIMSKDKNPAAKLEDIKRHAQNAIDNPRTGQHIDTKEFYNQILKNQVPETSKYSLKVNLYK